ncbi:hypothetical protein [Cellulomonas sp. B6]|uniref:hypothetical protein n=1 Tax=Cellulomonas sp. B6 TaxID=1295626 RepID=UPI00073B975F|nr:hypothetical protein [Cellulomonas sp. B6]KSW29921.1 hypothetical protein ATM99_00310 [Cellulomonas sp. B6]
MPDLRRALLTVATSAVAAWLITTNAPWWCVAPAVAVATTGALAWWQQARAARPRPEVAARPGWRTQPVLAGASLGGTLEVLGAAGDDVPSGTRLILAWSTDGVELSLHGVPLLTLGWDDVRLVETWPVQAGPHHSRGVRLFVRLDDCLELLPTYGRRGRHPALPRRAADLAAELRGVREIAVPPPPRPPVPPKPRTRVLVPSGDDERRPVDVALSTALLAASHSWGRELRLQPDERPGEVDEPWTGDDLSTTMFYMLRIEVPSVPLERGARVGDDASRVCRHLAELYPGLAADALDAYHYRYCFENR